MKAAIVAVCLCLLSACAGGPKANPSSGTEIVLEVLGKGLAKGDLDVINEYVAEDYKQHNPQAADGRAGLIEFIKGRSPDERQELHVVRIFEDGEYVWAHSELTVDDTDGKRLASYAIMDLWRVKNGMLVEHWDAMQEQPDKTASGRTMLDGPTELKDAGKTEANKKLVRDFVTAVLTNNEVERIEEFVGKTYAQHNPMAADGAEALRNFLRAARDWEQPFAYEVKRVVGAGNFVLVQARGEFGGTANAVYDLLRVENGKVVEHWDVIQPIPAESRNNNGMID
jgi:predicted SnoaL-like aldol condensation-catalyzing enzyme